MLRNHCYRKFRTKRKTWKPEEAVVEPKSFPEGNSKWENKTPPTTKKHARTHARTRKGLTTTRACVRERVLDN